MKHYTGISYQQNKSKETVNYILYSIDIGLAQLHVVTALTDMALLIHFVRLSIQPLKEFSTTFVSKS